MPTTAAKLPYLKVAAGILINGEGDVLIAQRVKNDGYQGQWEFPGGKLEAGESAQQALHRELEEEIGISVTEAKPFCTLEHRYPDRQVKLFVFLVSDFAGQPRAREGQGLRWVKAAELREIQFLKGNEAIVEQLIEFQQH